MKEELTIFLMSLIGGKLIIEKLMRCVMSSFYIRRKVPKEFHLVYDKLEVGPSLPSDHFSSELNVGHRQVSLSSNNVSAFQNSLILR